MVGVDSAKTTETPKSIHAASGALAGFITRTLTQPMDVLKIRFQLQVEPIKRGSSLSKYQNLTQAFKLIVKEEGIAALWKGTIPGQALSVVYGLVEFSTFEFVNRSLWSLGLAVNPKDPAVYLLCGSVAGMTATLAAQPLDVIRTRFVAQGREKIHHQEGVRGFYRGLVPSLIQSAPNAGAAFAFYAYFQKLYRNFSGTRKTASESDAYESMVCGFLAGATSKSVVYPLDVLKKRMQIQGFEEGRRGFGVFLRVKSFRHAVNETFRLEGLGGFFKGFTPSLWKAALSTGLNFFCYEQILRAYAGYYL